MEETSDRLSVVGATLDALPAGMEAAPAEVSGCSVDSGDLFQPRVNKRWDVRGAEVDEVAALVARAMQSDGWEVVSERPRFDSIKLRRGFGDWEATASLWSVGPADTFDGRLEQGVSIEAVVRGAAPCTGRTS